MADKKVTIAICGSMRCAAEMLAAGEYLIKKGYNCILPCHTEEFVSGDRQIGNTGEGAQRKIDGDLMRDYHKKIGNADAILVVNCDAKGVDNYIGGNTFVEMFSAHVQNKPIYVLNDLPKDSPYQEELLAMQPVCLKGDLYKIPDKVCDHTSVGVLVWKSFDDGNHLLLIERKKFPFGFAPPAGHRDGRMNMLDTAKDELKEETGLVAVKMKLIFYSRKENPCRRIGGAHHDWFVEEALEFSGELNPSPDETKQVGWYSEEQLNDLAQRTKDYLAGNIPEDEWQKSPGLEPVWYELLQELDVIWPPAIDNKCPED